MLGCFDVVARRGDADVDVARDFAGLSIALIVSVRPGDSGNVVLAFRVAARLDIRFSIDIAPGAQNFLTAAASVAVTSIVVTATPPSSLESGMKLSMLPSLLEPLSLKSCSPSQYSSADVGERDQLERTRSRSCDVVGESPL